MSYDKQGVYDTTFEKGLSASYTDKLIRAGLIWSSIFTSSYFLWWLA